MSDQLHKQIAFQTGIHEIMWTQDPPAYFHFFKKYTDLCPGAFTFLKNTPTSVLAFLPFQKIHRPLLIIFWLIVIPILSTTSQNSHWLLIHHLSTPIHDNKCHHDHIGIGLILGLLIHHLTVYVTFLSYNYLSTRNSHLTSWQWMRSA